MGEALRRTLLGCRNSGGRGHNIVFHSAPYRVGEPYHWHAHVWPKATTAAGLSSAPVAINVISPEEAAETLQVDAPRLASRPARRGGPRTERPAPGTRPGAGPIAVGPDQPQIPGVLRARHEGRGSASPGLPERSQASRPMGSRSAATGHWPGASTTAGRPRRRGCAGRAGSHSRARRPGRSRGPPTPGRCVPCGPGGSAWVPRTAAGCRLADRLDQVGHAGASRSSDRPPRWPPRPPPPSRPRARVAQVNPVEREVHARRHGAERRASSPKSPPAASGEPPDRVEVAQRGQGQRPPAERSASGSAPRQVAALLDPAHQRAATWLNPAASSATISSTSAEAGRPATGRPSGRPGRAVSTTASSSSRSTPTGPGRGAAWRMVASSSGASWASRSASVHTASPPPRPGGPGRTPHRVAGSAARRPRCAARRRSGPGGRRPGPARRAGRGVPGAAPGPTISTRSGATTPCSPSQAPARLRRPSVAAGAHGPSSLSSGTRSNQRKP